MVLRLFIFTFSSLLIVIGFFSPAYASIFINELSPASDPEWIELYNNSDQPQDLAGWYLVDAANHKKTLSGEISGHGYFVLENISSWLNNSGLETLSLFDNSSPSAQIDSITFGNSDLKTPANGKCAHRIPDGGAWISPGDCTKNSSNPVLPTITPISPTVTPTPPSAPKSPSMTPVITLLVSTSTPQPPKPTSTLAPQTPTPSVVLGIFIASPSATEIASPLTMPVSKPPSLYPLIPIVIGLITIFGSGVIFYFRHYKDDILAPWLKK